MSGSLVTIDVLIIAVVDVAPGRGRRQILGPLARIRATRCGPSGLGL